MRLPIRALCLLTVIALAALAPGAEALVKSPPEKAILPNGLRVIAVEDRSLPILAATLLVDVGWTSSCPRHPSLAHLAESLLETADTAKGSRFDLVARLEQAGARITTSSGFAGTAVAIEAGRDALTDVLQALRAIGFELQPSEANLDTARQQVIRRMRDARSFPLATGYLERRAIQHLFPGTPIANAIWPDEADFGRVTLAQVQEFLGRAFVPNNAVLVVVGDVDPASVFKESMDTFGSLTALPLPKAKPVDRQPLETKRREEIEFLDIKSSQVLVAFEAPGVEDPDMAAATLWDMALGGANDAWLERDFAGQYPSLRRLQVHYRPLPGKGLFTIGFESSDPEVDRILSALLTYLSTLHLQPPRGDGLDRLVTIRETHENTLTERRLDLAFQLGQAELTRSYTLAQGLLPALHRVTPPDMSRVAREVFGGSPVVMQVAHPLTCQLKTASTSRMATLPNGLRLLVKPYAGSEVAAVSFFARTGPGPDGKTGHANLLAEMLSEAYSPKSDKRAFSRQLDLIGGDLTVEAGPNGLFIGGFAEKNQLQKLLAIATRLVADPPLNPPLFEGARTRLAQELEDQLAFPGTHLFLGFMQKAFPADALPNLLSSTDSLTGLTLDDLKRYHATWMVPGNLSCVIVGNFDPDEVASQAARLLGELPTAPVPASAPLPPAFVGPLTAPESIDLTVQDQTGSGWLAFGYRMPPVASNWDKPETRADFVANMVIFHLLSWSRNGLIQRELIDKGLANEVSNLMYTTLGEAGWVFCGMRCAKEKLPEARAALQKLLEGLPQVNVSQENIKSAQATSRLYFARTMERSADQAKFLVSFLGAGVSESFFDEIEALYKDVTIDQVKAAAQRTFKNPVILTGTPK